MDETLHRKTAEGLLYTHSRLNANTSKTLEATSFLYALIELLEEEGLLSIEALDERKLAVFERLTDQYHENGMGALFQEPEYDKYAFDEAVTINCEARIHLCKAACCRLPFALSKQDIREGIVHWELGQPYMIEHGDDGYCTHMEQEGCRCTVYENRPVPCRGFDCRGDKRVWLDFEGRIPHPAVGQPDWLQVIAREKELEATP